MSGNTYYISTISSMLDFKIANVSWYTSYCEVLNDTILFNCEVITEEKAK